MKHIFTLFLLLPLLSLAQVADATEYDCAGNARSIHATLGSGKALIILSKGFDCIICQNAAIGWGNWASNNQQQVEVWGAMTYRSNSSRIATCTETNNWANNYGWNNIFTFIDSSRQYFEFGTPRYLVYDPSDSTLVYSGANAGEARNTALSISNVSLSTEERESLSGQFYLRDHHLILENYPAGRKSLELISLSGQVVEQWQFNATDQSVYLGHADAGIYLLRLRSAQSTEVYKIHLP